MVMEMLERTANRRKYMQMVDVDMLVPKDHLLRKIDVCVKCLWEKMGWRLRKTSEKEEREADPRNGIHAIKIHGGGFSSWNRFAKS
jgi:hypothetical protein